MGIKVIDIDSNSNTATFGYSPLSNDKKFSGTIRFRGDSNIRIKSNKIGKDSYDKIYHIYTAVDYKASRNIGDESGTKFRVNLAIIFQQ